ncbi:TetR/AcrR family transcriptional regulator [Rhodococcus sp. P-2]|uniref:TetR/AcrR family transcriptional regulator n=1 Tax=Rhodococcus sp. P-2 TaxID=2795031 RepID=UPI0019047428|nr:TetR/AcrR family transcriptional regulator [Rhodococcus sp. P-2]QQM21717.1 TetR/AcrR family transcriptional regulator [Rhodococcus sp. P-2]
MAAVPRSPEDRQRQILEVAVRMLRTEPFDQLSMDRVAAEAGVSSPLLFHYFKNKKGFQNAILEAASADLEDRMRPDPELPITSQLRSGIETFVDAVIEHPTIYLAVMRMAGSGDVRMRTIYRGMRRTFTTWIVAALTNLGIESNATVEATIAGWQAFMEEIVVNWIDEPTLERGEMVDLCERIFYHCLPAAGISVEQIVAATVVATASESGATQP